MLRRALMLKVVLWIVLSPPFAMAQLYVNVSNADKVASNNDRVKAHCGELLKAAKKHK